MVEHLLGKEVVVGSIPILGSKNRENSSAAEDTKCPAQLRKCEAFSDSA